MNFPRREETTNKELILTIIEIQGYLSRYGKSHTNWHETLNEVIERLEKIESGVEMNKKLAELTVRKSIDYYNNVAKALEDAGFVLVLDYETITEKHYIVAERSDKE